MRRLFAGLLYKGREYLGRLFGIAGAAPIPEPTVVTGIWGDVATVGLWADVSVTATWADVPVTGVWGD